ncbi:uncharacterized protein NECHADRAFT_81575 [Fusarium vanettenii 77-13-4]|uniref:Uncharacterized protein n=1 Tax=Fusarium vanettenii (strain ATCC MYA-4622 / CBS 123669 / FGSC 9596 / NRRL 45880 / 77-13-4) TaxID=660122 RepID=C7Z969_FUSV7|nr:uncharacterized protein NECHADRAFT_81575 [Fusarium vanettenii 77-13-4]EEU39421.1 predicted protein [Fusarium vanettenii 77-13-4]
MIASELNNTHTTQQTSLSSLPGLRRPDYEGDEFDDCASYYSLSELSETDPVRRVPAVEVRRQALAVPPRPKQDCKYPELLRNDEAMPLQVPGPWLEYPLVATDRYISGIPGPARVVISAGDYAGCDVIYHPIWSRTKFRHANYRPRGYQRLFSGYFETEYPHPICPSMTTNGYPMPCHSGYAGAQDFEWQCQVFDQAPWLTPESQWAQPYHGMQLPQYEEIYNPYMAQPLSYIQAA